ncbi:MAG: hypothetical protein JWR69_69, partial [Pedosphaera sp.]|nr:hypothetical protein [Pedosphaera sp.]
EASQIRNLPEDVMDELCMRQWEKVNFKIQVEPKSGTAAKPGMKERTGRSPDLGDWLAIAVEGARRRGFSIGKLANQETETNLHWLDDLRRQAVTLHRSQQLDYTA